MITARVTDTGQFTNSPLVAKAQRYYYQSLSKGETSRIHVKASEALIQRLKSSSLDETTLAIAILGLIENSDIFPLSKIREEFDDTVANTLKMLNKFSTILLNFRDPAENITELVQYSIASPRALYINLWYALAQLNYLLSNSDDELKKTASGIALSVHAPLSHRLGFNIIKDEFESIAFPFAFPEEYKSINKDLQSIENQGKEFLNRVTDRISKGLEKYEMSEFKLKSRIKKPYSIFRKIKDKSCRFSDIYDIYAVRLITENSDDCYKALGILNELFAPVDSRYKDYIQAPKRNGYRSLHNAFKEGKDGYFEVQIRTSEMDDFAENGIAAHWAYKEKKSANESILNQLGWMRQLSNSLEKAATAEEAMKLFKGEVERKQIFVFTPNHQIIELPLGATALDFAYAIHSKVGETCVGAKVDGNIINIKTPLSNGDTLEILTVKNSAPKRDWLKFTVTPKAIQQIRSYLKKQELESIMELGRKILIRELKRLKFKSANLKTDPKILEIQKHFKMSSYEELLEMIGKYKIKSDQLEEFLKFGFRTNKVIRQDFRYVSKDEEEKIGNWINIKDIPLVSAKCCSPEYGDDIVGIARMGNIAVHKKDCSKLANYSGEYSRIISLSWIQRPES